jgi:hypothetical protein
MTKHYPRKHLKGKESQNTQPSDILFVSMRAKPQAKA